MLRSRTLTITSGLLTVCACLGTAPARRSALQDASVVTVEIPVRSAGKELELRVSVGATPARSRLLVSLLSGAVVGTISPYGEREHTEGGVYTLPLDASAMSGRRVTFRVQVEEARGTKLRAPSAGELRGVEIVRGH